MTKFLFKTVEWCANAPN